MRIVLARMISAVVLATSTVAFLNAVKASASVPAPFDSSFAASGLATIETPLQKSDSVAADIITDTDGNLYVLYKSSAGLTHEVVTIGKYTSSGTPITQFGINGRTAPLNLWGSNFALQSNGKIVVTGWEAVKWQPNESFDSSDPAPVLTYRYTQNGHIDMSFGTNGVRKISSFPGKDFVGDEVLLAIHPTEDYIALGFGVRADNNANYYFIALRPSGRIESDWGNGGAREVAPTIGALRGSNSLQRIVILSDGSLLGIGSAFPNSGAGHIVLTKLNPSGSLDTAFDGASQNGNGNGIVFIRFGTADAARMTAVTVLQNNDIVLAGQATPAYLQPWYYAATKIGADGVVDSNFGSGGFMLSSLEVPGDNFLPKRLGIQADGRFVFSVTSTANSTTAGGFMRLETNGILDATGDCALCLWAGGNSRTQATSLVVSENKIVWAGALTAEKNSLVRRFLANGEVDETFNNITVQLNLDEWLAQLWVSKPQPDGSILFGGTAIGMRNYEGIWSGVIMKTTSTGALDTSFGLGGYQFLPAPTSEFTLSIRDLVVQANGKIIALAGGRDVNSTNPSILMWRLNANGTMDEYFGANGAVVTTDQNADLFPRTLLLTSPQSAPKILVVLTNFENQTGRPWIYRYTNTGALDPTFTDASNFQGGVRPLIGDGTGSFHTAIHAANGAIFVAGSGSIDSIEQTFVTRILENGSIDTSFAGGLVSWSSQHQVHPNFVSKMYVDDQSRIILMGSTDGQISRTAVSRLTRNGAFDTTFNGTGTQNFSFKDPAQLVHHESIEIAPFGNGYVTVGGGAESQGTSFRNFSGIARMKSNGGMDEEFGTNGILLPFSTEENILTAVTQLSDGSLLLLGFMINSEDKTAKNFLVKIPAPSAQTTTSTTTSTTTTSTVAPANTTPPTTIPKVETNADDDVKMVISVSQVAVLRRLQITVPRGGKVVMVSRTPRVCRITRNRVQATSTGTCRVAVTITEKKKKTTRTLALRVS